MFKKKIPAKSTLPDPAKVPQNRGTWEEAALTNVAITELVKKQICMGGGSQGSSVTRPQEK